MNILLSIVVAIYNTEKDLRRCIESLLRQQYACIEIILVDDGSTDRSGEICDEFEKKDLRIHAYHTENNGSVAARKFGVGKSKGNLITFVDSDDWIDTIMYSEMMKMYRMYQPDIISSGILYDNGNKSWVENDAFSEGFYNRKSILENVIPTMMYSSEIHRRAVTPSLCNKIFKKSLWIQAMENVSTQITYGEDAVVTYICIAQADSMAFTAKAWYHYCTHENSQVTNYDISSFIKIKQFSDYMELRFKELEIWEFMWYQLKQYVKLFLSVAVEKLYGIEINSPSYLFPSDLMRKGDRVVIYGAGKVGKSYYRNLYESNMVELVGWVDVNYERLLEQGYYVDSPENLKLMEFDYIILALNEEKTADSIKEYLYNMGVEEEKIIWKKPMKAGGENI